MKKNSKGFTLIELLAIIVILAIIAVITVPIILNIIENSRKGAAIDSAYGYKDAISKYYVSEMIDNPDLKLSGDYKINKDGKLEDESGNKHQISTSGTIPSNGYITIENNEIIGGCLTINDYKVELNDKEATATKGKCEFLEPGAEAYYFNPGSVENEVESGKCENYSEDNVNSGCMKWYVLNDYGSKVDLILDHNTTAEVNWAARDNTTGPDDEEGYVLYQLREDTKDWQVTYTPKKYESSKVTTAQYIDYNALGIKARLIEAEEVAEIVELDWTINDEKIFFTGDQKTKYEWLIKGNAYWTASPCRPSYLNYAWTVHNSGSLFDMGLSGKSGVRPVITVSKSQLLSE